LQGVNTFLLPAVAGDMLDLPAWAIAPFVALLLAIAVLPLAASHWWHANRNKLLVVTALSVPTVLYLAIVQFATGAPTLSALRHEIGEYLSFIALLGSLYIVSGGIVIAGDMKASPWLNTLMLAVGAVLANLIGTTGASMVLIRPMLRINRPRSRAGHIPIFFIFVVSNLGGLLTPLGDPPLFLGFLNGVPFFWTLGLWPEWLLANGLVVAIFLGWDIVAFQRETEQEGQGSREPFGIKGTINILWLVGVLAGVLMQAWLPAPWDKIVGCVVMAAMAILSLSLTPRVLREANAFGWGPILEVAILFVGIFITMVPALAVLNEHRDVIHLTEPWQYFWLTGVLSAFLDNAPTYVTFAALAVGLGDHAQLARDQPELLAAISCGAVFMGALTYIGNGPNFMVKAIAENSGYRMPSFFGYLAIAAAALLPVLFVVTWVFFATNL
jgi:Na+/H+ antiporter NhaD/arsenite permease-like protein